MNRQNKGRAKTLSMDKKTADMEIPKNETKYSVTHRRPSMIIYVLIVVLCVITAFNISNVARSQEVIPVFGTMLPISALTGVMSSFGNLCVIFIVVFYDKLGFYTGLILLISQFPVMVIQFIKQHSSQSIPGMFTTILTIVAIILIYRRNARINELQETEMEALRSRQKLSQRLFEQTATALVNAIDANDTYSHGHSLRVAEYSEKIARMAGKSEEECYKIYYIALLHDVGKLGIPNEIINKNGRLTDEEYEIIKQHPVMGEQILSSISEYPYLSIGAHFHHERYDGRGYPDRLKGEDIPEIARIISVADAYDAMSSNRSYRDAIPQQLVREEIVKGAGTQFDPEFAMVMQHLIDIDVEYKMKERKAVGELAGKDELDCGEYRSEISDGILVNRNITRIHMKSENIGENGNYGRGPAIILFDSLDGRVHDDERTIKDLIYFEYCEIWMNGNTVKKGVRDILTEIDVISEDNDRQAENGEVSYDIEASKYKDHVLIKINDGKKLVKITAALPDSSRFAYIGLTGEYCHISDVRIDKDTETIPEDYITRIAEEVSYINGPQGDIPNVQIDGMRSAATDGIVLTGNMSIRFHSMSLPTARLIWHCPYAVIFYSKNGKVNGPDYKEYALIRLDGEDAENDKNATNKVIINKMDDFEGWDAWKKKNKEGIDCVISFVKEGKVITTTTENFGLSVRNITTINGQSDKVFIALTGDQCALTDIRITK